MENKFFDCLSPRKIESPIVVSVPHSGIGVPEERQELKALAPSTFLCDVDYEIHEMWRDLCLEKNISFQRCLIHRYVLDLNRRLDQVDASMIQGHPKAPHSEKRGLFWTQTTKQEALGPGGQSFQPLSPSLAKKLVDTLWRPYYQWLHAELQRVKEKFGVAILIDAHSMPSRGTDFHSDPKQIRAEIVPGDLKGKSCHSSLTQSLQKIAESIPFSVILNQPYSGGGITQYFGKPREGIHALQIEVNRKIYMDEESKKIKTEGMQKLQHLAREFVKEISQSPLIF